VVRIVDLYCALLSGQNPASTRCDGSECPGSTVLACSHQVETFSVAVPVAVLEYRVSRTV
jgi:hypothetical protein